MFFTSPFLAVQTSFWPLLISVALFTMMTNVVLWFNLKVAFSSVAFSVFIVALIAFTWWKDVIREGNLGYHTHKLESALRVGMMLFILSEVFFFVSFFWAFFDASLVPTVELGMTWPPKGVTPLSVYSVPLLNTAILLSRGVTVTWAHHSLIGGYFARTAISLGITILLGAYFLSIQWLEYTEADFSLADGIFGSTFFVATGFHGMHVIVGTTFLFYVFILLVQGMLLSCHHFSFEAAAWYWHFVDVVWLFLFLSIYYWGTL